MTSTIRTDGAPSVVAVAIAAASGARSPTLPAKLTIEALAPIDLRKEFGDEPDVDEIYDHVVRLMQDTLDALAAERRLPVIG